MAAITLFIALPFADAAQCLGTTRKGAQCKRQLATGSYCSQHNPAVKHRAGKTKEGASCRNPPQTGSDYCRLHEPEPTSPP